MKRRNGLPGLPCAMTPFAMTLCAMTLCACAAPDYQPTPSAALAQVRFVNLGRPHICDSGTSFALHPDARGYASVPAGRMVHLTAEFKQGAGHCSPALRFMPQAGQTYDLAVEARAEQCFVTVMRHDPSAQYGLRLVTDAVPAPGICR